MNEITTLKTLLLTLAGLLTSLFSPIGDFMVAMLVLLTVNLVFGIAAAVSAGEGWSWKKASMFFVFCGGFFFTAGSMFTVGHFLHNDAEAALCVKYACFIAVYVFGTNILKNWRSMLKEGTATWKFVDVLLYVLTVQFVEKLPWVKKWQEERADGEAADSALAAQPMDERAAGKPAGSARSTSADEAAEKPAESARSTAADEAAGTKTYV